MIDRIPPQIRGALATLVAGAAAALGYTLTDDAAGAVVVALIWVVGGVVDVMRQRGER